MFGLRGGFAYKLACVEKFFGMIYSYLDKIGFVQV